LNNKLLGLFSDDIKLIDDIQESAMQARENHSLRLLDG